MIYILIFIGIILCIIGAFKGTGRYGDDNCFKDLIEKAGDLI